MHVRRYIVARKTVRNLLRNSVVHLFVRKESVCDVLRVRS